MAKRTAKKTVKRVAKKAAKKVAKAMQLHVLVSPKEHDRAMRKARRIGLTLSTFVRAAVEAYRP